MDKEMPNNKAQTSSAAESKPAAMTHEQLMKKLSENPRFKQGKSGEALVIVGARRVKPGRAPGADRPPT